MRAYVLPVVLKVSLLGVGVRSGQSGQPEQARFLREAEEIYRHIINHRDSITAMAR